MPDVPSEPPQTVPMTSSSTRIGARSAASRSGNTRSMKARPASMVGPVPPTPWMTSVSTGRPDASITFASFCLLKLSHPKLTSSAAPTLGWVQSASIIRCEYSFG